MRFLLGTVHNGNLVLGKPGLHTIVNAVLALIGFESFRNMIQSAYPFWWIYILKVRRLFWIISSDMWRGAKKKSKMFVHTISFFNLANRFTFENKLCIKQGS